MIVLNVDTFEDQNDGSSFQGLALRDAILIANADPDNEYQINLPAGTYNLTIANALQPTTDGSADAATLFQSRLATGDLDIVGNITIIGEDPSNTIISAGGDPNTGGNQDPFPGGGTGGTTPTTSTILGDRVFDVLAADRGGNTNAGILVLDKVTVRGGLSSADNIDTVSQGGGINIEVGAEATINNSIVSDNNSADNAGGIYNQGILTIYGSAIIDNLADAAAPDIIEGGGGGVLNETTGTLTIVNSTISGNRSASGGTVDPNGIPDGPGDGGGGVLSRGFTRIINSTIVNNFAQIGSGVYSETTSATTILYNTIVADNQGSPDLDGFFDPLSGFNLVTNGNGAILDGVNGNIVGGETTTLTNVFIGPLQNNGGLTPTHELLAGSPAIDAGDFTQENILFYFPDDPALDQRGSERISNGAIDIGAFEVFVPNTSITNNTPTQTSPASNNNNVGVNPTNNTTITTTTTTATTTTNSTDNSSVGTNNSTNNTNNTNITSNVGINNPTSTEDPLATSSTTDDSVDIPNVSEVLNDESTSDNEIVLDTPVFRFHNEDQPGTYLYTIEAESQNIRQNFPNFDEEGEAFKVAVNADADDDLIQMNRFQNNNVPGTYLYASEAESQDIRQNFPNFVEEGTAFFVYGADADRGDDVYRFQSISNPGTYLFAKEAEKDNIIANFSSEFSLEGVAFEVG